MAKVVSVNISEKKGEQKHPVSAIELKLRHGIVGDAHAGDWHRQISLLAEESIDAMRASCPIPLGSGVFAENINTKGLVLKSLPVGTHLRIGESEIEVTQIGKQCHSDCAIKKAAGKCVMPTHGIFATVVKGVDQVSGAVAEARSTGADIIVCTGGMSVDPDDSTPGGIRAAGAGVVSYGAPVLPGAMFLMGYFDDGTPVMGLPGCVMYAGVKPMTSQPRSTQSCTPSTRRTGRMPRAGSRISTTR